MITATYFWVCSGIGLGVIATCFWLWAINQVRLYRQHRAEEKKPLRIAGQDPHRWL